ncbi:MAG: alpha/beta hydrolase family protein, partial [Longimicrobiales bacterium]
DLYARMSPFWYADDINEPMLMIHGVADNNSGTFPVQSERMFAAVKGHGGTVRLVMLPHESHGYAARESVMHALAEMIGWFDEYVKNAPPRTRATSDN